jgi:hypothetical protein
VRSDHLYQLFAYLANLRPRLPKHKRVEGLLVYPRAGAGPDFRCEVHGHPVHFTTVNLGLEWADIRGELLALLGAHRDSRDG